MKFLGLFRSKRARQKEREIAVQTSVCSSRPYRRFDTLTPMSVNRRVYAALRESVPVLDAAILKIVRLCAGFNYETGNAFVSTYLSELLTYGSAVGEIIADSNGFYALYNGELDTLEVKRAANNFDIEFYNGSHRLENQDLIL